jgi:hypothetical protein
MHYIPIDEILQLQRDSLMEESRYVLEAVYEHYSEGIDGWMNDFGFEDDGIEEEGMKFDSWSVGDNSTFSYNITTAAPRIFIGSRGPIVGGILFVKADVEAGNENITVDIEFEEPKDDSTSLEPDHKPKKGPKKGPKDGKLQARIFPLTSEDGDIWELRIRVSLPLYLGYRNSTNDVYSRLVVFASVIITMTHPTPTRTRTRSLYTTGARSTSTEAILKNTNILLRPRTIRLSTMAPPTSHLRSCTVLVSNVESSITHHISV